jgi:glutathione synthase/RimK-type ligase-like ATP-grasp enzyme
MKKIRLEPYKLWSGGAKALGQRAGILRATRQQVAKHGDFDVIINWGRSERRFNGLYINAPEAVVEASDKLRTAKVFGEYRVPQPDFTESRETAQGWVDGGCAVVCRTLLRASEGRGIVIASKDSKQVLVKAPLYAKYVKKQDEYRVHVAFEKVVDVQQKKKRQEVPNEDVNYQIRNTANGWVYVRSEVSAPRCVRDAAIAAVAALSLDFGAVDIGFNVKEGLAVVYEVNTAPGLEGQTLDTYYEAFRAQMPQLDSGAYRRRRTLSRGE